MRLLGLALAGILLGAAPAAAQYFIPRPPAPIGALPADDVADIVHAMGLDPVGLPMQSGPFYVQRAVDDYGRMLRVTVDARRSQVISVEGGQRHYGYGYGYGRPHHPGYAALRPYDDLASPGSVMAPRGRQVQPPPQAAPARPAVKSAAVPPQKTPVPRKRPASAPEQAAAGSVEPVAPPPAAPQPPAPAAKPAEPAPAATPPVTPLE